MGGVKNLLMAFINKSNGFYIVYNPEFRELQTDRAGSLPVSERIIDKNKV